ncbi:MAG: type VI secretion system contractile sheath large subunit, partial [Desulfobulbaceae bacterium]|nr:type VI secretion system contractile sheath large subunit [Desulfobulbaceae bacterium]
MAEEKPKDAKKKERPEVTEDEMLIDEIVQVTRLQPSDEAYAVTRKGVQAFIDELLKPGREDIRVAQSIADEMIAQIDQKISRQVDTILHHEDFQKVESAWRSLKFLIDRTDFRQNIKIEMLSVNKKDLLDDFEDSPEIIKSGLYRLAYTSEYGQFGGQPYGLMVGNYESSPSTPDVKLLQHMASVSTMSHAPFVAAAGAGFFNLEDFSGLPGLKDLKSIFEGPQYAKWQSFRDSEDARSVGLS